MATKLITEKKSIFITGGSLGLGYALVEFSILLGHDVVFCARNERKVTEAIQRLSSKVSPGQKLKGLVSDVANIESLESLQGIFLNDGFSPNVLVCNAGVVGPIGKFLDCEMEDWYRAFYVNFFGTSNTLKVFLPNIINKNWGRIIHISGGGATSPLQGMTSYSSSKAAAVRFIETLAKEYGRPGITFNSIAPGIIKSRLLDQMVLAGEKLIGKPLYSRFKERRYSNMDTTQKALDLYGFLLSEQSDMINGKLISAEWDNWGNWPNFPLKLDSDVYTLRRVVGKDRGFIEGDI